MTPAHKPFPQITLQRMVANPAHVPDNQLWGAESGPGGLADSPAGLAAWLLDHGDGWGQPAAPVTSAVLGHTSHGHPAGDLTRDDLLDNITLCWLTNTAVSAARLYWEISSACTTPSASRSRRP